MTRVDVLIVGQGLAGTTLAWSLLHEGATPFVIDREEPVTSSKIAAGLMTSVTGQRLVPSWRWDELWPAACEFYRDLEERLSEPLLAIRPMVRWLTTAIEQEALARRRAAGDLERWIAPLTTPLRSDWYPLAGEQIELPAGGRLDVPRFLARSRQEFATRGLYAPCDLRDPDALQVAATEVRLPELGLQADRVIFCEGIGARTNPWLQSLRFNATRGEILTVRIPGLDEDRVLHRGLWLARQMGDLYRVGATYDWKDLDAGPTAAGLAELTGRLAELLRLPFEVVGHDAAIRPILHHLPPLAGIRPAQPRVGCFNGLGSKGSLQAPFFARQFARHLVYGAPLDPEVDWNQRRDLRPEP